MIDIRLANALAYAEMNWPVFPVTKNKTPGITAWEKNATTDPEQIRKWFEARRCNFGFTPGRANIAVIDLDCHDPEKNGEKHLKEFMAEHNGTLEATYTVRTPSGGLHLYFHAENLRSKNNYLPGVDIKSGGGYVVIPGSTTDKGGYVVNKNLPVKELPDWFKDAYGHQKAADDAGTDDPMLYNTKITPDTPDKIEQAIRIIGNCPPAEEGERNDTLFRLMRDVCRCGVSLDRAIELYQSHGIDKIGLDADSTEVVNTIRSAYSDMSDFGRESEEGRKALIAMFDVVPGPDGFKADRFGSDWTELEAQAAPPRKWFIEGWLSADEGYTVLFTGKGGAGKSALALELIRCLATGEDWCGMRVLRGARSMYIGCEDSEEELIRRVHKRTGKKAVPKDTIRLVSRLGEDNVLCAAATQGGVMKPAPFYNELREQAGKFFGQEGGVLILDTLADIYAGNENDRTQVSQFIKTYLGRLGRDLGVTVIVLAHPSKNAGTGFSGSSAWDGAFRCRWELNYQNKEGNGGLLELVLAKSNAVIPGRKINLVNQNGIFHIADTAKRDETVQREIVRMIKEAYQEGNPFGRTMRAARPINRVKIPDPISGEPIGEKEIEEVLAELMSRGIIKPEQTKRGTFLKAEEPGE